MVVASKVKNFERMMLLTSDLFVSLDQGSSFNYAAGNWQELTGYHSSDLIGKSFTNFSSFDIRAFKEEAIKKDSTHNFHCFFKHQEGHLLNIYWQGFWTDDELWLVGKLDEPDLNNQKIHEKDELHRVLVEHGSDMLALFSEDINFIYSSGSTERLLGYTEGQLNGVAAFSLIHPDDAPMVQQKLEQVLVSEGYTTISDFRFRHANGEWRWLESTLSNQLNNPSVKALVTSSRDVTERRNSRQLLLESERRFRSLFEDNPDAVIAENELGFIVDVNPAGSLLFDAKREEIIGHHISDFLPPEAVAQCAHYLQKAFEGNTVDFTLTADFEGIGQRVFEIKKIPVKVNGEILTIHTVIKDVTAMANSQQAVAQHARKLNTILESITDAFITLDRKWNFTYINNEAEKLVSLDRNFHLGKCIWEVYHCEIGGEFYSQFHSSVESGKAAQFVAYFELKDIWLEMKAFPSAEGLSVYFSNITQRVKTQQELEKLSLVAYHTTNGVVITDANRKIEWVNEGFTRLTGYSFNEAVGRIPFELLHKNIPDVKPFELVLEQMQNGMPVSFEIESRKKNGDSIWLLLQVNPILNEEGKLTRYVTIQTDISEQKKTQQELKKLSQVASRTDNGVVITDAAGRVEWVNDGFSRMTGYTLTDLLGKKPGELLQGPETDREDVRIMSDKLRSGEHFNTILLNYNKSGEKFWVSMDITPIYDGKGDITQFIAIQRDITFRREAEANMHSMSQDLYRQNTDLQQFTYIVSHNLRAPVANALGLSNMLIKLNKHSARYDQSVAYLHKSMLHLDTVLTDMNTILSIRDRKGTLDQEIIEIGTVLDQVQYSFQEMLLKCGGEIENGIPGGVVVKANRAYLYSIFHNLISNAIKYRSDDRALKIGVQCLSDSEKGCLISFSDNGVGFDTKRAAGDIFKLYKRFHSDRKGRGIGLYLVKTHLETMGGHVEVSSQVGVGTKFLIYLLK